MFQSWASARFAVRFDAAHARHCQDVHRRPGITVQILRLFCSNPTHVFGNNRPLLHHLKPVTHGFHRLWRRSAAAKIPTFALKNRVREYGAQRRTLTQSATVAAIPSTLSPPQYFPILTGLHQQLAAPLPRLSYLATGESPMAQPRSTHVPRERTRTTERISQ